MKVIKEESLKFQLTIKEAEDNNINVDNCELSIKGLLVRRTYISIKDTLEVESYLRGKKQVTVYLTITRETKI